MESLFRTIFSRFSMHFSPSSAKGYTCSVVFSHHQAILSTTSKPFQSLFHPGLALPYSVLLSAWF